MYYNGKDKFYNTVFTIGKWYAVFGGAIKYCISDYGDSVYLHGGLDMYLQNTPLTNSEIEKAAFLQLVEHAKDDIANGRTISSEAFKQRLADKKATLLQKETIMQNDIKQQFPAITITETEGDISITHEFNTFEDYDNYVDLQQQLDYNSEQEEYHQQGSSNLCNCDGCCDQEEEDFIAFTPEELFVINQVLGHVTGNSVIKSILDKIEPYVDREALEESFDDVYVQQTDVVDGSFKLPFAGVKLQANGYELKIG